jgi:lipopolysaccharide biosynthesis glycosyltransferase
MAAHVINIAFISDDNYVAHLTVTIISMLEHIGANHPSSERSTLNIYILDAGIAPASRDMLLRSVAGNAGQCRLSWSITFTPVSIAETLHVSGRALPYLNRSIFAKLYLTELLPPQVQKIIFLDSDLLVRRDVMDLWFTDIRGKVLAAAKDLITPEMIKLLYPDEVTWKLDWKVANTGVMVLDIRQLRDRQAHKELLDIATRHPLPFLEQDAWNLYCQGDWFELDRRWNVTMMTVMDAVGLGANPTGSLDYPFIVHFCGKPKPWDCKLSARLPWVDQYYKRLATTAWGGRFPKNESAERIEAEKCVFGLRIMSRHIESGQGRGENEKRFLPTLHRALVRSIGSITTDSTRPAAPEFTDAFDLIHKRVAIGRNIYARFDSKVFLNELCQELARSF